MRKIFGASLAALVLVGLAVIPSQAAITGDYLEVRNADVWTGPCFANSEVDLTGKRAIIAWRINKGSWQGTDLSGLTVVAVVKASATLGDPYRNPLPSESVLILDQRADAQQRAALVNFAKSRAGKLLDNVVRVDFAPISLEVGKGANHGSDVLKAGDLAVVKTRSLCSGDIMCGNETVYYPPLTRLDHAMPAFTEVSSFSGKGLGVVWNNRDGRSAFIGTFSD
ncbi:MAG TPA: DUF1326 domain-containing protein [Terriglobia bacterium]|jgi:hypothetical protein|nr:DUF1326 domain-containing protein [Terriglobia bacterium]